MPVRPFCQPIVNKIYKPTFSSISRSSQRIHCNASSNIIGSLCCFRLFSLVRCDKFDVCINAAVIASVRGFAGAEPFPFSRALESHLVLLFRCSVHHSQCRSGCCILKCFTDCCRNLVSGGSVRLVENFSHLPQVDFPTQEAEQERRRRENKRFQKWTF